MAEPLTISFQADTSKASSAMASLAASIVGNMTSIGVAMSGGAANTNGFGGTLQGLANNASRAAQAVSADVQKISATTISAASRDGATLEGVVRGFTRAAATSNTAQAAVSAGVSGTATAVTTLAAQVPTLGLVLGGFLAFAAAKIVFDSVAGSVETAKQKVEEFTKIGRQAEGAGVGTSFFQRMTADAKALGLETQQVVAILNTARAATAERIGEGKGASNGSAIGNRLSQNVSAGNLTAADRATFDAAGTQEAKIRAILDLIDKLRAGSRDLAAFDLAGKMFGPEFEQSLRNGIDATRIMREQLDSTATVVAGIRIIDPQEIERANQLKERFDSVTQTLAEAFAPIQKDIEASVLNTAETFVRLEQTLARIVGFAAQFYGVIKDIDSAVERVLTQIPLLKNMTDLGRNPLSDILPAEVQGPQPLAVRVRPRGPDRSAVLPSLHPAAGRSGGGATESLDGVETLINTLEKARDTAKAELENVGKTNVEREKAVALAKAEAAAREDVQKGKRTDPNLDADERARVLGAAEAWQTYKDQVMDAQQALRQTAEQARYFGQMAADGISDAILEGKSFGDVLQSLEKQLAKAALQGIFTGQGPLAALMGMAPAASSGSNAVGGLAGLFTGSGGLGSLFRANGGPVSAGQPYTVGEAGREVFVPGESGRMYPIGSGGMGAATGAVNVYNYAGNDTQATATRRSDGSVDIMVDRLDSALAKRVGSGRGSLAAVAGGPRRLRG